MDRHIPLVLANDEIEIQIDPGSGRIMALRNIVQDLDLIQGALDTPPWRLELAPNQEWLEHYSEFSYVVEDRAEGMAAMLRWETEVGITLTSQITVPPTGPALRLTIAAENRGSFAIDKIEYPYITGIGTLDRPGLSTCLVHSQGTGFLFRDPAHLFLPEAGRKQGLRYSPYPEGFNGSTMQFMAYYVEGVGGFDFGTRDSGKSMKWFNFFKDVETAALMASIMHQNGQIEPGRDFVPGYPVEIGALSEGTWYEAAERYKQWAVKQPWTAQGTLSDRAKKAEEGPEVAQWLLEDVGICTFGVNAAHDRSAWLDAFHRMAGTPVFHILGPNWARTGQDYMNKIPAGALEEWLPANFSAANLDIIGKNGDYWAPFEFDLLCSHQGKRPEPVLASRMVLPHKKYSFDRYVFPFMCPATEFWHTFHVARDEQLMAECSPDSIYYDISVNNVLMSCRSPHHGHAPGGGEEIAGAFGRMYADTKAAMARAAGRYVPLGAEMISELTVPLFDYYQARAEASPVSNFEADFWRQWLVEGKVEKIPLFAYVYHEYGPVRMDGWSKLSTEVGDIFYWVASKVTLWGGLFELNYEFSALETLDGENDDPSEHYFHFTPRSYTVDAEKAAFVGQVARLRTGWANPYLAYGAMLPPPDLPAPAVSLDYFLYNCSQHTPHYEERGTVSVPSVLCSAWNYGGERAALLLINLQQEAQTVQVPLALRDLRLDQDEGLKLVQRQGEETIPLGKAASEQIVSLTLPPRQFVGLEICR